MKEERRRKEGTKISITFSVFKMKEGRKEDEGRKMKEGRKEGM